jgi:16S rRNA (cytidine1402-2'-O)-methyltransferase
MSGGGTLYVVATPIGNLEDITLRAIDVLKSVDRIAAEDTRHTLKLLSHLGIEGKPLDAIHEHSPPRDIARLVERMENGESVAVVTDAGTPAVSDPGGALVEKAIACGVRVVPIPGPSAVLAALTVSGLASGAGFRFFAFLPRDGAERRAVIGVIASTAEPTVLYESPERCAATLNELAAVMPNRAACVARELTKMHEETIRGTLSDIAGAEREGWRGEIAIVLGAWSPEARATEVDEGAIDARIDEELDKGLHAKTVAEVVAAWSGRPKRDIYARVVERKGARG